MSNTPIDVTGRYQLPEGLTNVTFPQKASDRELLAWYNRYSGSTHELAKFATREIAEGRCLELKLAMDHLSMSAQTTKKENKTVMNKKTAAAIKAGKGKKEKPSAKKATGEKGTRNGSLLDHTLHKLAGENPRREGTHGAKSWEVIKNGMTYRDAIDAGARNKDIRHDVNLGRMAMVAPGGKVPAKVASAPKVTKPAKAGSTNVGSPATDIAA